MPAGMSGARGFIGPIGDDLPSIIPILVSLIIFFSSFTFAFNTFDRRNAEFASDRAILEVARVLQSNGYIIGTENFETLCASLNITDVKYLAGITDAYTSPTGSRKIDPFHAEFYEMARLDGSGRTRLECRAPGLEEGFQMTSGFLGSRRLILKIFPVVVEEKKVVKPMHLVVMAWK